MTNPWEIFPNRVISHLAVDEHLRQISYSPEEIQKKTIEILNRNGTSFGQRVAYFHIPFCEKLCTFCAFYRIKKDAALLESFIDHLIDHLHWFSEYPYLTSVPFEALFFGGGTPTTLTISQMNRLMRAIKECIPLTPGAEFTSESSFANISDEMLHALHDGGVNRMSLGVQTFSERLRKFIGRSCPPDDVIEKIEKTRRVMEIVNLDLIYNFPTQTLEEWEEDLRIAARSGVDGICVHPLIPVEETPLFKMSAREGADPIEDSRRQYDFYRMAQNILST